MGKFRVKVEKLAENDIKKHLKSGNKSSIKKIETFLLELSEHPYTGAGQPEPLKYELQGKWARRINSKDRLIYKVDEKVGTVFVISAMGHYLDK
ncbi:MAG: Txe/YoeB family addiction module toxin [Brumimicrobium sp.]|nr:Txe/YoeB family addiction module toxin [Brumimicrobium sp.]